MSVMGPAKRKQIRNQREAIRSLNIASAVDKDIFHAAVRDGIAAANRGEFASRDEIKAMFAKWGVDGVA
ncbi:hypothetical protein LU699_12675 [Luteimonas fraxinea]|uniref:Antitoxin VbhA domain-containing protein n=1 Tax=Luteimonas fraxinea TaxID=2901869 RepID=A0ABS8UHC5_9GAMM|nr:hypothetical protein [Luteimonas fraxinea]MCD9098131.1 hypothetical protein [Luteimonas fraxinea]MCD9125339.1 hypothetical protein [Luteimonas fraxinea]UHH09144.1 hypothetical protein LU699_12675 [Luteimonas fraxinea]